MAQTSSTTTAETAEQNVYRATEEGDIKKEDDVTVKLEPVECVVCLGAARRDALELAARTPAGTCLRAFLARYAAAGADLVSAESSRLVCRACVDLVALLERAEREYNKIKETFQTLLSKNPLFAGSSPPPPPLGAVKLELGPAPATGPDSEDEPLARTKRKHTGKGVKKKKKTSTSRKRKTASNLQLYEWECDECGVRGEAGGAVALAAHKLTMHTLNEELDIKTENPADRERSQSPYNNGLENCSDVAFDDFDDDDEDSTFNPEDFFALEPKKKTKVIQKDRKTWHPCGQCNARFSSMARLEHHRQKHDGSKPPYICEVCGAHYKHKRACDIHIALHKGISDWKCEECNKLFPSKNALQRHNNIHTGKLNYQCDLCGKSFIHTSSFKMHKLSHSGVKPHACDVCGLALMTRSHLKRHKRIHSGEKRHECNVCGKRFSERYNLAAHGKSHEAPPPAADAEPAPRRRLFRCHFCTERFERRYMLERHMSLLHGRTLERPPPTPRNTMSKLLKAQAQARHSVPPAPAPDPPDGDVKETRPPPAAGAPAPSKLLAQLSSSSLLAPVSWSGAYAAEFGLRADYPH